MEPLGPWSQDVKTSKLLRHSDSLKVEEPIVANFELELYSPLCNSDELSSFFLIGLAIMLSSQQ